MNRYDLFPTLVLHYENFLPDEQCKQIVEGLDRQKFIPYGALEGDAVTSFTSYNTPLTSICKCDGILLHYLQDKLQNVIDQYSLLSGTFDSTLSNVWFSIQRKGSKLKEHTHPGSVVSGAFYLNVDDNSSAITFRTPNPYTVFTTVTRPTDYNQKQFTFKPKTGDLIVFPSWLAHGSGGEENLSDDRVIMSFNSVYNDLQ